MFTDACQLTIGRAAGRARVWRRRRERHNEECIQRYNRWGGGSIHVWAGITHFGRADLVVFDRNVNEQTYVRVVLALRRTGHLTT